MITETQIQNFLYEIDEPVGDDNAVLSDDQIFVLAKKIFNNQKILLELIKDEWNKRIMGFVMDWWSIVDFYVDGTLYLQSLGR